MEFLKINGRNFYNMIINANNMLEEQKEFVNSLNVFPVPDGDTGTNMSMTLRAAVSEIEGMSSASIGAISNKLAKGALMGARGNSGVILSQILRGISKGLENKEEVSAKEFAFSIGEGSRAAYKAVMRPTEGTILTIIRAAGECAGNSTNDNITELMKEISDYSEVVLNKTPDMLPVLKKAKVVDAGGAGLLIILKGMFAALNENIDSATIREAVQSKNISAAKELGKQEIKFGYCTEFIIMGDSSNIESFRQDLNPHGDSMIVVGTDDVIKVHIHTNDPGLILSKAVKLGELTKIKIENMREQHRHILEDIQPDKEPTKAANENAEDHVEENEAIEKKYAFISVASGEGIKNIFKDLGVDYVIEGGQTMNPSTQDILDSIDKINADNIFVLPNNKNIIMAATQAAELSNKNIIVIPTKTIPQGITSITEFNPDISLEKNLDNIKNAINDVATGLITYAVRDTEIDGQIIKEGDILGIKESNIVENGSDVFEVCEKLISDMVNSDSELITLFYGKDCEESKANELVEKLENKYPEIDIQAYNGQQPLYYFILSVE